jgi:SAM-dependent methyltransferase
MKDRTYVDKEYWDTVYRLGDYLKKKENVVLDGNDGEDEFDDKILRAAKGREVLDIGCGDGLFTLEIADLARRVVGVDFSEDALVCATKGRSRAGPKRIRFQRADANSLPFANEEFDLVVSRRGPATANTKTLSEVYRVLKRNGLLMEITIGEKDKENLARIFGRGQMYSVKERISLMKRRMLEQAGFREIRVKDYIATEIFPSMKRLIIRLSDSPIIPGFDAEKDSGFLSIIERKCRTSRGIETPVHRVTIVARK